MDYVLHDDTHLDELIKILPFPFLILDGEAVIYANEAALRLYKYSSLETFAGTPLCDLIHPDELEEYARQVAIALDRNEPLPVSEQRRICADGSVIHVQSRGVPVMWRGRRCIMGTQNDQTAIIAAHEAREKSDRWARHLVDWARVSLIALDDSRNCTAANPNAIRQLGYGSEADIVGREIREIIPNIARENPDDPVAKRLFARLFEVGESVETDDVVLSRTDLSRFHARLWGRPFGPPGRVEGYAITFTDITTELAEKRALAAREKTVHALQRALEEESRNSALQNLATVISHETIQPLSAIINTVGSLTRADAKNLGSGSGNWLEKVVFIREQAERASTIINGMRQLFEARESERSPVSINVIAAETFDVALRELGDRDIDFDMNLASGLPQVEGNRIQIQQVIYNLMRNAADAVEQSDRRSIVLRTALTAGAEIAVSVEDSGTGIPEDARAHLFEPFTSSRVNGTGMGLFTCRAIVDAHNGRIDVSENKPHGTVFRIVLPAATTPNT